MSRATEFITVPPDVICDAIAEIPFDGFHPRGPCPLLVAIMTVHAGKGRAFRGYNRT